MLTIVLPAYNEASTLGSLLEAIHRMLEDSRIEGRVIVVNDGSTDRTGDIARNFKARFQLELLEWPCNRGLAEALKQGLSHAASASKDGDIIVTMDADSSHPPDLIPQMVAKAGEGAQVVIASRYRKGSTVRGLSPSRRALSWGASYLFRLFLPMSGVRDYTCGYRAYDAKLLALAFDRFGDALIQQKGFGCTLELLLKIRNLHPTVGEVPFALRYDLKQSESKMRIWPTIKDTLGLLGRHSFGRGA